MARVSCGTERGISTAMAMVQRKHKLNEQQVHAISRALADPRRFAILQQIAATDVLLCSALAEQALISPATISHHLKELSEVGLLDVVREGRCAQLRLRREVWAAYLARLSQI